MSPVEILSNPITPIKTVNKKYATPGSILTYTCTLNLPSGAPKLYSASFIDVLAVPLTLVPNSLKVNGQSASGNLTIGISLGDLLPGTTTTITFQAKVSGFPITPNPIPNSGVIKYSPDPIDCPPNEPCPPEQWILIPTNTVHTQINAAIIDKSDGGFYKSALYTSSTIGSIITYMLFVTNTGNVDANNVIVTDLLSKDVIFIKDSVEVDGSPLPGVSPVSGIPINTVSAGVQKIVYFKVKVISLPPGNILHNTGSVAFTYTVDPAFPNGVSGHGMTAPFSIPIKAPSFQLTQSSDTSFAAPNSVVTYTLLLDYDTDTQPYNVQIKSLLPFYLAFIPNTVTIDGIPKAGDPSTGIALSVIGQGSSVVTFNALIFGIPPGGIIETTATATYSYTDIPPVSISSNTNSIQINSPSFDPSQGGFNKLVDQSVIQVGNTLTYTITLTNTGTVAATNIVFRDILSPSLKYIEPSFTLNGLLIKNVDLLAGINIGNCAVNETKIITFKAQVVSMPSNNSLINIASNDYLFFINPDDPVLTKGSATSSPASTQVIAPRVTFEKQVDTNFTTVCSTLTYTLILRNDSLVTLDTVFVKDLLPKTLKYVNKSLRINGLPSSEDIIKGVTLPDLAPSRYHVISFKATIPPCPLDGPLLNKAICSYNYILPSNPTPTATTLESNETSTIVSSCVPCEPCCFKHCCFEHFIHCGCNHHSPYYHDYYENSCL